ncbi:MAG: cytochrome P450 [Halieaceae bacterium]
MSAIDPSELFSLEAIENPYPLYERMREHAPVCQLGTARAFLVGTRAAVEEAVKRHDEFSANLEAMLICGEDQQPRIFNLAVSGSASQVIATADEPQHSVHRRLMMPPLKATAIAELEPELREFARQRVATLQKNRGGDCCAILSEPLPAYVVIRLLDLGDDALDAIRRWAMMGGDMLAGRLEEDDVQHLLDEAMAQGAYLFEHFAAISALQPELRGDSLIATLASGVDEGLVSVEQAVGILVILFGAAGESTAGLLGSCIHRLAADDTLQQHLRSHPELIPSFIEEVVRLDPPFKFHYRVVRKHTTLCGTSLQEGDLLLLSWAAANRDPACWDQPDQLLLDRPHLKRHLGFGYGIHFCIGAPLARLEVRIALEELLTGTTRFRLDPHQPSVYAPSIFVRRLEHLTLTIT